MTESQGEEKPPMRWISKAIVPAALLALAAGCTDNGRDGNGNGMFDLSGLTGSSSAPDRMAFACNDDRMFRVNFNDDGNEAVVDAGDKTYRLDLQDRNGRQRQYEGDRADLVVSGNSARLRVRGDDDYTDCERVRSS
jgi:hypothetical protein